MALSAKEIKQAQKSALALRKFNKKLYGSEYAPQTFNEPNYVNAPLGGYARLDPTLTAATGFKSGKTNKPLGGGRPVAPDFSQALRVAARPDLNTFKQDTARQLAPAVVNAPIAQVTNRKASHPQGQIAQTLRAIEGVQN